MGPSFVTLRSGISTSGKNWSSGSMIFKRRTILCREGVSSYHHQQSGIGETVQFQPKTNCKTQDFFVSPLPRFFLVKRKNNQELRAGSVFGGRKREISRRSAAQCCSSQRSARRATTQSSRGYQWFADCCGGAAPAGCGLRGTLGFYFLIF